MEIFGIPRPLQMGASHPEHRASTRLVPHKYIRSPNRNWWDHLSLLKVTVFCRVLVFLRVRVISFGINLRGCGERVLMVGEDIAVEVPGSTFLLHPAGRSCQVGTLSALHPRQRSSLWRPNQSLTLISGFPPPGSPAPVAPPSSQGIGTHMRTDLPQCDPLSVSVVQ